MRKRIEPVQASAFTPSASSASRAKRMAFIGRRPRVKKKAHLASCSPMHRARVTDRSRSVALSRLLLQNPDQTGPSGAGRRRELYRGRQDDRRLCAGCLSGSVPQLWRNDVHRQLRGRHLSKIFRVLPPLTAPKTWWHLIRMQLGTKSRRMPKQIENGEADQDANVQVGW